MPPKIRLTYSYLTSKSTHVKHVSLIHICPINGANIKIYIRIYKYAAYEAYYKGLYVPYYPTVCYVNK